MQLDLIRAVLGAYSRADAPLTNSDLYGALVDAGAVSEDQLHSKHAIGAAGHLHLPLKHKVHWIQQTLKPLG